ncbi:hypothetical protein ABZT17_28010 [Streptomyces sp. NPDC005648]|uniref:hypothetical protein n=1 Tax=Streptomyces sp. NPDC005648 TaxID=3157044 RepID=UPI0033AE1C5B
MEHVGWAAAALSAFGGVIVVVNYVLDQVPVLSAKAEKAIAALRRLRAAWRATDEEGRERQLCSTKEKRENAGRR